MSTNGPGSSVNEAAHAWLFFAGEDLRMAELALKESLFNQVCFHPHQATEKTLKTVLAYRSKTPPRTPRLVDLVTLLEEEPNLELGEFADGLRRLENYYVPVRYPDALTGALSEGLPDEQEAKDALATSTEVSRVVQARVERVEGTEGPV